jgi:two-component system nitrate/nitrite response regulator NarL
MIRIAIISKYKEDLNTINIMLAKQDDFRIVSIGTDGYDALRSAKTQRPDIIIMDFRMHDIESPELAPIIKRNSPSTSFIVLFSQDEQNDVDKALKAGISGCLSRHGDFAHLPSSVRSVFHGGLYINKTVKDRALHYFSILKTLKTAENSKNPHTSRTLFSPTELCIFHGIMHGQTDKEIAKRLNICIGSLRNCINRVKHKTGLQNRTQITVHALLDGTISVEEIKDMFL